MSTVVTSLVDYDYNYYDNLAEKKKMKILKPHKCKKCKMTFTEEIRLLRHYKKAHPSKPEHHQQKWYWDNPASP